MFIVQRDNYLNRILFMEPDQAETLASQLLQAAAEIRTGLVLPPAGKIHTGQ